MFDSSRHSRISFPVVSLLLSLGIFASLAGTKPGWTGSRTAALPQGFNITIIDRTDVFAPAVLNDLGQVAGISRQTQNFDLARWSPNSGLRVFGLPFGENLVVIRDMNNLGEIVGETERRAFVMLQNETFPVLHDGRGLDLRNAYAINDSSQVVVGEGPNNFGIGGVWKDGAFTELSDFPAEIDNPFGRGINPQGTVCGAIAEVVNGLTEQHAVIWNSPGGPIDISPDDTATHAQFGDSINGAGQVLGWTLDSSSGQSVFHAWLRESGGTRTNIGKASIQGALGTQGVITGWWLSGNGLVLITLDDAVNNRVGYHFWQNGQVVRYDSLIPAASGYTLGQPLDMNNSGEILTTVQTGTTVYAAILTPKGPDQASPVISNVAPASGAISETPVQVRADIADASSVLWTAFIDKGDFNAIRVDGVTKGADAIHFDQALPGGSHTLDIEVRDSSGNLSTITRSFTVDTRPTLKSFSFTPSTTKGGTTITGNLELTSPAPAGGLRVTFKSSKKKALKPPKAFTILAGAITPSFQYKTAKVKRDSDFTITATIGDVSKQAALRLTRR